MFRGKKKKLFAAAGILTVFLVVFCIPTIRASAVFDESTAVRFRNYDKTSIESSVLFIGTHLIHMQALTDELYEAAMDTASSADQHNIYYKSELADGIWFDITDAGGLSDITADGVPVDEAELDELWVTCYTGVNGITKDAKTGETVCIFDTPSPYDLLNLPELESIAQIYTNKYSEESEGIDRYFYDKLYEFFNTEVKNEQTESYDQMLKNLQSCYESYSIAEMDEQAQILMSLMETVDAARRTEVFYQLCEKDQSLLDVLFDVVSGTAYEPSETYDDASFVADEALVEAVGNSMQQCAQSYITYQSKQLDEGSTVIRKYIYEQSQKLIEICKAGEDVAVSSELTAVLAQIRYAMNVETDVVGDAQQELSLIQNQFLKTEQESYQSLLQGGVSDSYQAAKNQQQSEAAKKAILQSDQTVLEAKREDMQFFITAVRLRKSSADALNYIYERIAWANAQEANIKKDDFQSYTKESLFAHIKWLKEEAQKIVDADASLMSELEKLKNSLKNYQEKQQEALDANNPALASQYAALANDTSKQISAEEKRLNALLNSDTASEKEKAEAEVALGNSALLDSVEELKEDALTALRTGETDGLTETLDQLKTLGAEDALKQVQAELENTELSKKEKEALQKELEQAIADSKDSSLHEKVNAGSDGSSSDESGNGSNAAKLSASELKNLIEQSFGSDFSALDKEKQIAAMAALQWLYEEYSNANAKNLLKEYIALCSDSMYVYLQLEDSGKTEYVPLKVIAEVTRYRYVYSDSEQEATMAKNAKTLQFHVGSNKVAKSDGTVEEIKNYKVEYQNQTPYIDRATAQTYFACEAEYIADTSYGICLTAELKALAEQLYETFVGQS